jgi:hypothetical protein
MILNYESETMQEEMDMAKFKVIFRILSTETEETQIIY